MNFKAMVIRLHQYGKELYRIRVNKPDPIPGASGLPGSNLAIVVPLRLFTADKEL